MELVERYLHAVAGYLPKAQAPDIIAELRDSLLSQFEERESALGSSLTPGEAEALLRERGHPMLVAAGYLPQQYLIGPATYPYWRQGMRLLLIVAALMHLVIAGIAVATGQEAVRALVHGATGWWATVLTWSALMTLVLALIEHKQLKLGVLNLDRWSPSKLPPADPLFKISRGDALFEVVIGILVLGWFSGFIDFAATFGDRVPSVSMAAAWVPFLTPILLLIGAGAALSAVNFVLPRWDAPRLLTHALINVATIAIAVALFRADSLVVLRIEHENAGRLLEVINLGMRVMLAIIAAVSAFELFQDARRLARLRRLRA